MAIEIPGVDAEKGLALCDGDMNIYLRSLQLYVTNMPAILAKLRNVSSETLRDYAVSIHGAKGISEYVGAEEVRKTAKELEAMAKAGNLTGILAQNEAFIKYAENLVDGIRTWLKKTGAAKN